MDDITAVIKEVVAYSSQLTTWALAVLGVTVATIISTSYTRPIDQKFRLANLLFIPGWIFLSFSIYHGEQITRKYLAAIMVKPELIPKLASDINDLFSDQRLCFLVSLMFFGVWLFVFLLQWVFVNSISGSKTK